MTKPSIKNVMEYCWVEHYFCYCSILVGISLKTPRTKNKLYGEKKLHYHGLSEDIMGQQTPFLTDNEMDFLYNVM